MVSAFAIGGEELAGLSARSAGAIVQTLHHPDNPQANITTFGLNSTADRTLIVNQRVNDLVYDPISQRLYLSIPPSAGSYANTVVPFDPLSMTFGTPLPVGTNPNKLALSGNGHYLYVGVDGEALVKRIDLHSGMIDLQFGLGAGPYPPFGCGSRLMRDGQVLPGSGDSIVIARRSTECSPPYAGLAVFDNGIKRLQEPGDSLHRSTFALPADGTIVYSYDRDSTAATITRDAITSDGLAFLSYRGFAMDDFQHGIKWAGDLLYGSDGRVLDPTTLESIGRFDYVAGHEYAPRAQHEPDAAANRMYFVTSSPNTNYELQVFELDSRKPLAIMPLPAVSGFPTDITRWGAHGMALGTDSGQLVLVHTLRIVGPLDSDEDSDGLRDINEGPCGSDPLLASSLPERLDTPADDDGDTLVNEALPPGAEAYDCDGDGYTGTVEAHVTTSDQDPCGGSGWPSDLVPGGFQPNALNVQDVASFLTPVRRIGKSPPHADYNARWDLVPGGTIGGAINVQDIAATIAGPSGYPPMFGGARAFGKACPWAP
jgi:hypothetical protein